MKVWPARDEQGHRRDLPPVWSGLLALAARPSSISMNAAERTRLLDQCDELFRDCPVDRHLLSRRRSRKQSAGAGPAVPRRPRPPHAADASRGADLAVAAVVQRRRRSISSTGTSTAKRRSGLPAWLPAHPARRPLRRGSVSRNLTKLRLYPDLTHNKLCQYEVPQWDQAYALTLGREAVNPRPGRVCRHPQSLCALQRRLYLLLRRCPRRCEQDRVQRARLGSRHGTCATS